MYDSSIIGRSPAWRARTSWSSIRTRTPAVTAGLDAALGTLRLADGPSIRCTTLSEGPFGIESQKDVEQVTLPLRRLVEQDNAADAFVIACFSDPGLQVCREATRRPVFGINECGVLTALARGDRFGIIAITAKSIARHRRAICGRWGSPTGSRASARSA